MEDVYFDFNGLVKDIRRRKPSNVVPLLNYLSNEYIRSIISLLMERGVKPGEKYFFNKRIADKIGFDKVFKSMTYLSSEKPFTALGYSPLNIDGLYYGIWLALNVHDCIDTEESCVLLNRDTLFYAENIYNYLIEKQ